MDKHKNLSLSRRRPRNLKMLNLIETQFYRKWRLAHDLLNTSTIPIGLFDQLQKNSYYPIKFSRHSPIYFAHIIDTEEGARGYVKCQFYVMFKDFPKCEPKRTDCQVSHNSVNYLISFLSLTLFYGVMCTCKQYTIDAE
ncbi:hypothetical protein RF11_08762 [Thelohanellus kitauei]|uniref:Uncharacterized protein n=1 Tax=Thelohanellus kitauei TaxID=669202 RepID=A0A0C2NBD5_THEKT|nr:hypothetical protein RF11_08762 [Thelohanellus kitauei]